LHSRTYDGRDLFINKNILYKKYLYSFNVVSKVIINATKKFRTTQPRTALGKNLIA